MPLNRRSFLSLSALLSAGSFLQTKANTTQTNHMQIPATFSPVILATNWGFEGSTDAFCAKAKAAGYDGIEVWWPSTEAARNELFQALEKYQLQVGFLTGGSSSDPKKHFEQFSEMISGAILQNRIQPLYINCHSGKDFFSIKENEPFILLTQELNSKTGIPVYHETHRGRMLYAAPIARQYLQQFPELKLTLDISHWCNVHESLLQDQSATIQMALNRTGHIHARIGHPEGPQVNDPRAPEWKQAVDQHLQWWDTVVQNAIARGASQMTFLTEFGPADYLPTLPYSRQPVANQWDINVYMLQLIRNRYSTKK
ncbi:MAG: sugar phosphate isomerase/epimerase [Sediminibacterium sp.]|nr:sugar phosphate isomerase/epimerase [Sediminibacterium sp.]